ncbi:DnaJ domain-containing protein [Desulfuromusa kysingii]|uniref:DnaJ domain-containing protein n=1 Tax=Desulfuromusa kysingii TaxID=37625 RepID=A0A1H4AZI4_9BACT|nr:DnaJ domain-containing protein [Desulfuromusa kysingii]SEA41260.1 DnaJ domain-containing protein [Desulfuromusa kysingii]
MVLYLLILLFVVIGIYWLLTLPAKQIAAIVMTAGPVVVIIVGGVLTLLRRGAIGFPLIIMGVSWWRRIRSKRSTSSDKGNKSTVRSAHLEMELDHDTGEMDGKLLTGHRQGARLSSLSEEELLSLISEFRSDTESLSLLESFLDRYHPDWRDRTDSAASGNQGHRSDFDNMTRQEAYQILGLQPQASQEEIHQAWKRLIKGVHPDSGGSDFLAAKINAARDILLQQQS